jgi:NADPH:quinone reductase-like Zn-dependent oxidoreductase
MKYVMLKNSFGIEHLSIGSGPEPRPSDDEILVRMKADSLNYVDLAVVTGKLDPAIQLPFIPVADGAGVVMEVGPQVQGFRPGDRVSTLYIPSWRGGRYRREHTPLGIRPGAGVVPGQLSEYKTFRTQELIRVPDSLSFAEASTLPIAGLTAWNALAYGRIKAGDTVLLHGTGGVSIFALQFAKMFGARVIITSSDDEKLERAICLGADSTINYKHQPDASEEIMRITDHQGVDLVVETVGGHNLQQSLNALRPQGHISVVGFLSGVEASVNLIALNLNRATITGISVGSTDDFTDMLTAISAHGMKPVIDSTFPLDRTVDAFKRLESGKHFGKVVIEL